MKTTTFAVLAALIVAGSAVPAMAESAEQYPQTGRESYPIPAIQGVISVSKPSIVLDTGREAYPKPVVQGNLGARTTTFGR